ncbi:hypothetical protein QE152_g1792 [Popillia japonica]|uniref:Uncharacterized protein n=1 Tax=Popillia japonica TaxID=7064 RepID=A0AAW1N5N4_POPJA
MPSKYVMPLADFRTRIAESLIKCKKTVNTSKRGRPPLDITSLHTPLTSKKIMLSDVHYKKLGQMALITFLCLAINKSQLDVNMVIVEEEPMFSVASVRVFDGYNFHRIVIDKLLQVLAVEQNYCFGKVCCVYIFSAQLEH